MTEQKELGCLLMRSGHTVTTQGRANGGGVNNRQFSGFEGYLFY